jgi:TfoX/Sxy family transcriptional regulator of competence genes
MVYDEPLAQRVRQALSGRDGITEQKMFGGLCFMTGGNMIAGVNKDDVMVRVGPDKHEEALARRGARPMDFSGRPMQGFLFVDGSALTNDVDLKSWLDDCLSFVGSMPVKKARPSKPSARRPR